MRIAAALLVALSGLAHADDAARQKKRLAAEAFEKDAKTTRDPAKYVACGQAYLDIYNDDPKSPNGDEALYNAGVCFDEGHSVAGALQAYEQLARSFPRSKLMPRAIARRGRLYQRIGQLAKAAELYELYAKTYGGEKDAYQALSDATYFRRVLGDDAKVIANTEFFVRSFGVKRHVEAAQAMFALGPIYARKSADVYVRHMRDFLSKFGKDQDLRAQAYLGIGESLWKSACATPDADGLCVRVTRARTLPLATKKLKAVAGQKRCGPANATTIVPIARDPKLVAEAVVAFAAADKELERLGSGSTLPHVTYARARVKLLLADRDLEEYLAVRFPAGLDFTPNTQKQKTSMTRFNDYVSQKKKRGTQAQDKYTAILQLKDAWTSVAAMQRLGFASQTFGLELMTAEIPVDVRSGEFAVEKMEAFCDKMTEVAEPLIKRAIDGYDQCLAKAGQLATNHKSMAACARERGSLGPTTFAVAREMTPELPLALPVTSELPIRDSANQPQAFQDVLAKLWKLKGPRPIPAADCTALLRDLEAVAKKHRVADVEAMIGYTLGRCGQVDNAKAAYKRALRIEPKHGLSISNLGELEHRAGDRKAAKNLWTTALAADPKLFGARVGLATLALAELRALPSKDVNRGPLEKDAEHHAMSAAAVSDGDHPAPYVQLAILAIGKAQYSMARYYIEQARRIAHTPNTELVYDVLLAKEGTNTHAILDVATAGPPSDEVQLALAIHYLDLRRYDDANTALAKVRTPSYDVLIARGIAARGQAKYADAEKRYTEAIALDASRPEAHFDLGVLWKDYTAARATDVATAKAAFKKAADAFRRAGTPDAKAFADDCDKALATLP